MRRIKQWCVSAGTTLAAALLAVSVAQAQIQRATPIIIEGEVAPGGGGLVVTNLNSPFTNGNGQVGFTGSLDNGGSTDNFVWFDTGVIWRNSDALPTVLTGAEGTMGISDIGEFIYSPATDGEDSVFGDSGLIIRETDPAPEFPGQFISFASRPQMIDDGTSSWVSGITDTMGGSTDFRALYQENGGVITKVLASGDLVGGFTIDTNGIDFDYSFSDSGSHHISVLLMDTGSTADDGFVYVDGALVARETDPSGDGDNWDNFDIVDINDNGDYVFSGDTDGATTGDEFIAYNGTIVLREGDTIDGITLASSASVQFLSISNRGQACFTWSTGGEEYLFVADADRIRQTARLVFQTGADVDFDGDGVADANITDFNASTGIGPGGEFSADNFIHIEVDLIPDGEIDDIEAILRISAPAACSAGNVNDIAGLPEDALTISGSDGGSNRTVEVGTGDMFTLDLNASTAGPATPTYVIWVWLGEGGNAGTLSQGGSELGCATNPTPLAPGLSPQPRFCLIGQGIPARACGSANVKNSPSLGPWSIDASLNNAITLTFQGLIQDTAAAHPQGFSVTNSITLDVQ